MLVKYLCGIVSRNQSISMAAPARSSNVFASPHKLRAQSLDPVPSCRAHCFVVVHHLAGKFRQHLIRFEVKPLRLEELEEDLDAQWHQEAKKLDHRKNLVFDP